MELRRLGLASKILIVVPNDILQQFAEEFQHFYPLARLLVPGKDDFTPPAEMSSGHASPQATGTP